MKKTIIDKNNNVNIEDCLVRIDELDGITKHIIELISDLSDDKDNIKKELEDRFKYLNKANKNINDKIKVENIKLEEHIKEYNSYKNFTNDALNYTINDLIKKNDDSILIKDSIKSLKEDIFNMKITIGVLMGIFIIIQIINIVQYMVQHIK